MKKNVLYIGGFVLPNKNAAAQRVIANGKILNELGYKVFYVGVTKNKENIKIENSFENNDFDFNQIIYPVTKKEWIKYLTQIDEIIRIIEQRIKDKIEFIIAYNYPAIALEKLRKYCLKKKIKIYADCTEWYGINNKNFLFNILKYTDTTLRMNIIHKRIDGIICISEFLKNKYRYKKTIVIPPLIDLNEKKWNVKNQNQNKNQCIKFVYSGSPGIENNKKAKDRLDIFINYLNLLNDKYNFLFEIIGVNKEEYLKAFPRDKEKINKLKNKIIFRGKLSHNQTIFEIKGADFLVFLRNNDRVANAGFPTKFVEGLSAGTPVITNKTSDIEKYLDNNKNGYFLDIDNEKENIDKLQFILELNRENIMKLKENCKKGNKFDYRLYKEKFNLFLN